MKDQSTSRLERPAEGRVIAGVARGLADRLDVPVGSVLVGTRRTASDRGAVSCHPR
ncbi:MAG: PspC domain-containing protein, partial [Acidimicrobiia bacterium]